jgi:Rha family phage regulatory protein
MLTGKELEEYIYLEANRLVSLILETPGNLEYKKLYMSGGYLYAITRCMGRQEIAPSFRVDGDERGNSERNFEFRLVEYKGKWYADSRDVAVMVGKRHDNLLRDIDNYIHVLETSTLRTAVIAPVSEFFILDEYLSGGRSYKRYLLTKKGCDMVAHKMIGPKGILFTAAYVTKFEEMEKRLAGPSIPTQELSPQLQVLVNLELEQRRLAARQDRIEAEIGSMKNALMKKD